MMVLYQMVEKFFEIGLAVLIQYRRVTDTQPPSRSQPRCRSKYRAYEYVARVKTQTVIDLVPQIGYVDS